MTRKDNKNHWFRYERPYGITSTFPKSLNWQGRMCYIISFSSLAIVIIVGVNYNANSTIVAFIFVSIIIAFKIITFLKSNYIELAKTHKS